MYMFTNSKKILMAIVLCAVVVIFLLYMNKNSARSMSADNISHPTDIATSTRIVDAIIQSPFRIIKVYDSPSSKQTIYIATERSTTECGADGQKSRCENDTMCGSRYTASTCYFFTEPKYVSGAGAETKFIGSLTGAGWLDVDSLDMPDDTYLYFITHESDAGDGYSTTYQLDLNTGVFTPGRKVISHEGI